MTIQRKITLVDMTSREKKKHGNTPRRLRAYMYVHTNEIVNLLAK